MTNEPKRIFLGSVTVEDGATLALSIPDNLTPDEIRVILERVEAKRAADAAAESRRLHEMFLKETRNER